MNSKQVKPSFRIFKTLLIIVTILFLKDNITNFSNLIISEWFEQFIFLCCGYIVVSNNILKYKENPNETL
jgi:uncharacterized membrane protein SirB2